MEEIDAIEKLGRSGLDALQSERLRGQVKYVYENSPAYRAKMDAIRLKPSDIKSVKDISKLPFVEKADLRDNYPFGYMCVPKKEIARVQGTSGTTGKLTIAGYTVRDLEIWSEVTARCLRMAGCTDESVVHICYGYGLFTGGLGLHGGAERIGALIVPASAGNTRRQVMLIEDFRADILCCTPSYALYIAEEAEKTGLKPSDIPLSAGVFGAEPWTNEMRREIEQKLGITAHDIYGLCEIIGPGVSGECREQNGLHVWEDHFFPEILDPDTLEPVPDGTPGELVFSALTKTGMPLLRYRTRDISMLYAEECPCGRTHRRMRRVTGRTDDMIIIRGVNVFPTQVESVLVGICSDAGEITPNYQIVVLREHGRDELSVRVELSEKMFSDTVKGLEALTGKIEHELLSAIGLKIKVSLVEPGTIPRSEGKAKRVIDMRNV